MVFDPAGISNGVALNDVIRAGPKLQQSLPKVLLRFRQNKVAIICDIQEMYLQISLAPEDRPFHRFLWRDNKQEPATFEFNRVVFGANASRFLARYTWQGTMPISTPAPILVQRKRSLSQLTWITPRTLFEAMRKALSS